jgi:protein-tyrosine-phosphatase
MKKTPTRIHFICTGNIYRSRLAEAYLRSKKFPNIIVSSSGTKAMEQQKGPIMWYALRLLYRNNLLSYMSDTWEQTMPEHLINADIVIFIGKQNYVFCTERFSIPQKYQVWELLDFDDRDLNNKPLDIEREAKSIFVSEQIFFGIKEKIDALISSYNLDI